MPKIISERCELVKLCDINCIGPVFRHTVLNVTELAIIYYLTHSAGSDIFSEIFRPVC